MSSPDDWFYNKPQQKRSPDSGSPLTSTATAVSFCTLQIIAQASAKVIHSDRWFDLSCLIHAHEHRITRVSITPDILFHAAVPPCVGCTRLILTDPPRSCCSARIRSPSPRFCRTLREADQGAPTAPRRRLPPGVCRRPTPRAAPKAGPVALLDREKTKTCPFEFTATPGTSLSRTPQRPPWARAFQFSDVYCSRREVPCGSISVSA